ASLSELISTKPKPRERPVARSVMTDADVVVPTSENSCSRSSLVALNARLPTYSFLPMNLLLARSWAAPVSPGIVWAKFLPGEEVVCGGAAQNNQDRQSYSRGSWGRQGGSGALARRRRPLVERRPMDGEVDLGSAHLHGTRADGVLKVVIDRPARRNAL